MLKHFKSPPSNRAFRGHNSGSVPVRKRLRFSDNVALRTGLQERQICHAVNRRNDPARTSGGIPEGKEKLVFPEDLQFEIWGNLK